MYKVWHVDKYKITFKLVINHWTDKILVAYCSFLRPTSGSDHFRHIHEYFSPQNISSIKKLFMKIA